MEVNGKYVKNLRVGKGWTQQHLADACEVSLRTIQRVEKFGTASNETVLGLAAVLEIKSADLSIVPKLQPDDLAPVRVRDFGLWIILAGFGGFVLGVAVMLLYLVFA